MRRYHINPKTGVPSICRAESAKCPYGGATGEQNHYKTYGEAQKKSQEYFEKIYNILPQGITTNSEEILNEIEQKMKVKQNEVDKLKTGTPFEITKEVVSTKDESLIVGIIQGELFKDSGWTVTSAALQNPNIPKTLLNDILYDFPDGYDSNTRKWAVMNKSLTHEQLVNIINDENEDIEVRSLAFRNPNINKEYVENLIYNEEKKLEKLPHSMVLYSEYANNHTEMIKDEALIIRTRESAGISSAMSMAMKFVPWHLTYRRDLKKESNQ